MLARLLVVGVLAAGLGQGQAKCPQGCTCGPDQRGRKQVTCENGGMTNSAFLNYIDIDTRVLKVTAPETYPNKLTIGPFFRRVRAFIEQITITHSEVPAIGANSFFGLSLLSRLDLSNNRLTNLDQSHFNGLKKLRHLDLSNNLIASIPSGAFHHMPELQTLNLSGNLLPRLAPSMFLRLDNLRSLDLSGNSPSSLDPDVFEDVQELQELRCSHCDLTKISPRLYQMVPRLRVLDLSDNHLSVLRPGEYVQLRDLKQLRLAGNHFASVDSLPFAGHRLRELDISRNQLSTLPEDLFHDVTVRHLDLSRNGLKSLPETVLRPLGDHLHWLSLAGNQLPQQEIEALGGTAPHLQHLSLADMDVLSLSDQLWSSLPKLTALNMSANYLLSLSEHMLRSLPRLKRLDVSDNQLARLSPLVVHQLGRLEKVRLHGNPWACDSCRVRPLLKWIMGEGRRKDLCGGRQACIRCAEPPHMAGLEVRRLNSSALPPCGPAAEVPPAERCRLKGGGDARLERYCAAVMTQPPSSAATSQLGVIVGCVLALLLLTAVILALLVYNRHSAIYYTHEDERDDADVYQKPDVNKNKKRVRIATIDEVNGKDESLFVDDERLEEFQNG